MRSEHSVGLHMAQPKCPRAARSSGPETRVVRFMESWLVKDSFAVLGEPAGGQ